MKAATIAAAVVLVGLLLVALQSPPSVAVPPPKETDQHALPKRCKSYLYIRGSDLYIDSNCPQDYEVYINGRPVQPWAGRLAVQLNESVVVIEFKGSLNITFYAVREPGGYTFVDRRTSRRYSDYVVIHRAGSTT